MTRDHAFALIGRMLQRYEPARADEVLCALEQTEFPPVPEGSERGVISVHFQAMARDTSMSNPTLRQYRYWCPESAIDSEIPAAGALGLHGSYLTDLRARIYVPHCAVEAIRKANHGR